jgi:hypothetical protein
MKTYAGVIGCALNQGEDYSGGDAWIGFSDIKLG